MKFPIILKGKLKLVDYDTGKPYFEDYDLEIDNEKNQLIVCSDDECIYILPEHVDELIEILQWRKENRQ